MRTVGRQDGHISPDKINQPAAYAANEDTMKSIATGQFVLFALGALLANAAHAQDRRSYYNQVLPKSNYGVLCIADNNRGLQYAMSMMGTKVGGGQCTDLVKMALAHSGARQADFSSYRRYIWGGLVSGGVRPGDIIQFEGCIFRWTSGNSWGTFNMDHHTAIIGSVNGSVLDLIHQNAPIGGPVSMQKLDLKWKTQGTYVIWRPVKF